MTIEEAISEFWHGVTAYEVQNRNNITMDITDEARMMAIAALEQQNFTRWHDLRKNPEVLPKHENDVEIVKDEGINVNLLGKEDELIKKRIIKK